MEKKEQPKPIVKIISIGWLAASVVFIAMKVSGPKEAHDEPVSRALMQRDRRPAAVSDLFRDLEKCVHKRARRGEPAVTAQLTASPCKAICLNGGGGDRCHRDYYDLIQDSSWYPK